MTDDYEPWPETELRAVMAWHKRAADGWRENSRMRDDHDRRVKALEDAIKCHDALRERFLEQSMLLRAANAKLSELGELPEQRGAHAA